MATQVGDIKVIASIDTSQYKRGAGEIKKANEDIGRTADKTTSRSSAGFSRLAKVGMAAAAAAAIAVTAALTKAATASWNQVDAVEQATVGLRAYEKDGKKVNAVLSDLIKYARSDMGVLFNRKDLFQSAQMLKLNGVSTKDLSKNVQILSRSVGLGLGNWQDLNSVVGRVVSTGRLSGIEFDQLTQYGFKLDKSLRNTNLSATELFKALDKGIPVDAMEGQANTIRGLGIRMESAFRGIGDAILGVDADTSKFIKGGLGDRLVTAMGNITTLMKSAAPIIGNAIGFIMQKFDEWWPKIVNVGRQIADYLIPKLQNLWTKIQEIMPTLQVFWNQSLKPIAHTIGTVLVHAIGLLIDALAWLIGALKPAIDWINQSEGRTQVFNATILGIVGAMAVFKAALAIQGVMNAFMASLAAGKGAFMIFKGALSAPITISIVVGAALIAMQLIIDKGKETMDVLDRLGEAQRNMSDAQGNAVKGLQDLAKNGTAAQKKRAKKALASPSLYGAVGDGYAKGLSSQQKKVNNATSTLMNGSIKAGEKTLKIRSPSKVFQYMGKQVGNGFIKGIDGTDKQIQAKIRETMSNVIATARNKLKDLQSKRNEASSSISSGLLPGLGEGDIKASLQERLNAIKAFQANLKRLAKTGISKKFLQEIAAGGLDRGADVAQQLLGMSSGDLKHVDALRKAAINASKNVGNFVGDQLYGSGIQAAKGLVNGLISQRKRIEEAMFKVAKGMASTFKKALKIRSPSKVFEGFGQQIVAGLNNGMIASQQGLNNTVSNLVASRSALPSVSGAAVDSIERVSGANYTINIGTIAKEVDADAVIRKLTKMQELEAKGITT